MSTGGDDTEVRPREVRLGLVLYGGVSLAVYIGGVTQELHAAVRGRGVYKILRKLLGASIAVDVISGTSAGGINGVLLATALANGAELAGLDELWRLHGDFAKLLRKAGEDDPPSLLDGKGYFQDRLEDAFRKILSTAETGPVTESIDLFATATDFHGQLGWVFDDLGKVIQLKDHRRVFTLKHRAGRKGDLNEKCGKLDAEQREQWVKALATTCRATAAFPGAFEPVEVAADDRASGGKSISRDALLHDWSKSKSTRRFVLVDGGVLDNKPFTHTLQAIYRRTSDRQVDRRLLYVEPDPENLQRKSSGKEETYETPDFLSVVTGALSTLPAYESIVADLADLAMHNAEVARYKELINAVKGSALVMGNEPAGTPTSDQPLTPDEIERGASERELEQGFRVNVYLTARLQSYRESFLRCVLEARESDGSARAADEKLPRERIEELAQTLANNIGFGFLRLYDLDFPVRRLFAVTYNIYDRLYPEPNRKTPPLTDEEAKPLRKLLRALNVHIQMYKLVERLELKRRGEFACSGELSTPKLDGPKVNEAISKLLADVFWPGPALRGWLLREKVWELESLDEFATALASSSYGSEPQKEKSIDEEWELDDAQLPPNASLLRLLAASERRTLQKFEDASAIEDYRSFERLDRLTYPFEAMAHLEQKDRIDLLRISPDSATIGLCDRDAYDKITGEAVGHFGAFVKRSWRSNDFLWGRLDGMTLLMQDLLQSRKDLFDLSERPFSVEEISEALPRLESLKGELTAFPLREWLKGEHVIPQLLQPGEKDEEKERKDKAAVAKAIEALIMAAQAEIVIEGFPSVIEDAVAQGAEWRTVPAKAGQKPAEELDGAVAQWSATQISSLLADAKKQAAGDGPGLSALTAFKRYKVGAETIVNVPLLVVMGLASHAGVLLMRLLDTGIRRRMPAFMMTAVTPVLSVAKGLITFVYLFASTARTRPLLNALRVVAITLLVIGIVRRKQLWWTDEGVDLLWGTVFIAGPLLFLMLDAMIAFGPRLRSIGRLLLVLAVFAAVYGYATDKFDWLPKVSLPEDTTKLAFFVGPIGAAVLGWILGRLGKVTTLQKKEGTRG